MADAGNPATKRAMDMKFEIVVIPVSDVDRAKQFYAGLGWRLDADFAAGDWRVVQFTPPGSATSVIFGMPAEAIKTGSVDQVLGIDDIYASIEKRVLSLSKLTPVGVR